MKAITLWQPWASLLASGAKKYETRTWATTYRGQLAIHAAKKFPKEEIELCWEEPFKTSLSKSGLKVEDLPRGAIIAIANLTDCLKVNEEFIKNLAGTTELEFGDYEIGKYAWVLTDVRPIKPIAVSGKQGLWNWNEADIE
ncbi:ASCH domain-containing protein [Dendrosporobacter sp. 1207_IL3150]|uniref:ASCH domain-containing protein n=1 Tax=Dendrosporobacter sp. 1207_IL3150 TaxID=3084054 RepID=UPI002FD94FD6